MTRLPTANAVAHLIASLRALGEPPRKGHLPRINDLEARLLNAIARDLAGVPIPDGYPAGAPAGRGGPTILVEDEDGHEERIPATSVEAAALARGAAAERIRDHHHQLTVRAVQAVEDAVTGLQVAFAALASIDDLVNIAPPTPKTCDHCTDKRGRGGDRPVYVRGTIGDRLPRAMALCEACYGFVIQTAEAGSHAGWLPSDEQIADHEKRGRWRIRTAGRPRRRLS